MLNNTKYKSFAYCGEQYLPYEDLPPPLNLYSKRSILIQSTKGRMPKPRNFKGLHYWSKSGVDEWLAENLDSSEGSE